MGPGRRRRALRVPSSEGTGVAGSAVRLTGVLKNVHGGARETGSAAFGEVEPDSQMETVLFDAARLAYRWAERDPFAEGCTR